MNISSFDDLLQAARTQPQPQRLLFVFVGVELPEDSTPEQKASFEAGEGGALVPLMCVDKLPDELTDFSALADESKAMGQYWQMVFVAAMAGKKGQSPSSADAEQPLQNMVEAIKRGDHSSFIPFDPQGRAIAFS